MTDTSKGDLQQTRDADATASSGALALHLIEYLHPTGETELAQDVLSL
jgi:hypothetical protein